MQDIKTCDFQLELPIGVRAMGRGCSPLEFSNSHLGKKNNSGNIQAKPLDFSASNGKKYSGKRLQSPPPPPPQ